MTQIAPWENPNLPAPFAHVEREIEGRQRRFALWRWEERLVWRDLNYPRLWWATLDVAATLADWERAIVEQWFGRAFTSECKKSCIGQRIGLPSECVFYLDRSFYVIATKDGTGKAREKAANIWLNFTPFGDEHTKRKIERSPSIWHPNRCFFQVDREILRAFAPVLLERLAPSLICLIKQGKSAPSFRIMRDLAVWNVHREILFTDITRNHREIYQKLLSHFGLPEESLFHVWGERKQLNGVQLQFFVKQDYQAWQIQKSVLLVTTMHELLELQLRLRDAMRPILTDAEIEEILTIPARP